MPPTDKRSDAQTVIDALEASGTGQHRLDVLRDVANKGGTLKGLLDAAIARPGLFGTVTIGKLQDAIAVIAVKEHAAATRKTPLIPGKPVEDPPATVAPAKA